MSQLKHINDINIFSFIHFYFFKSGEINMRKLNKCLIFFFFFSLVHDLEYIILSKAISQTPIFMCVY